MRGVLKKHAGGVLACLAGLILLCWSGAARAEPVDLQIDMQDDKVVLTFVWPTPVHVTHSQNGRELLLRADRALELQRPKLPLRLEDAWIAYISEGYDTVLIVATKAVRFDVTKRGRRVFITLIPRTDTAVADSEQTRSGTIRLEMLKAQMLSETGQRDEALQALNRLNDQYPDTPSILFRLANLEHDLARQRPAASFYRRALLHDPENEDIIEAYQKFRRARGARLTTNYLFIDLENAQVENRGRVTAQIPVHDNLRAGVIYELNHVDIDPTLTTDGSLTSFSGVRQRGAILLQYDTEAGSSIIGSLFANESEVGAGLRYDRPDAYGITTVFLDFQKPNWDYVVGIIEDGVRDRVSVRRTYQVGPRIHGNIAPAFYRYGVGDIRNAATSAGIEGSLRYRPALMWPLFLEYLIDAEYKTSANRRLDIDGNEFKPLPIISREVHVADVAFDKTFFDTLQLVAFGGAQRDRLGKAGPVFGARLHYETPKHFGVTLTFDQRPDPQNTDRIGREVGLNMFWMFNKFFEINIIISKRF